MSRPQQQQHGVPDSTDVNVSLKRKLNPGDYYVMYKNEWYVADKGTTTSPRTIALFDGVIFVNSKGKYEVAKDRGFSLNENTIKELKMFLFNEGKTLDDLPKFRVNEADKYPNGPLTLCRESNGDLVAYSAIDVHNPSN